MCSLVFSRPRAHESHLSMRLGVYADSEPFSDVDAVVCFALLHGVVTGSYYVLNHLRLPVGSTLQLPGE